MEKIKIGKSIMTDNYYSENSNALSKKLTIALAGNPNCGKTTLFNNLTGMHHHVGNWSGKTVTVERKEGKTEYNGYTFDIIDLPGTYSLSSRSLEEEITASYLKKEKPDVVVNIIDAANIERNLYLTLQLIEIGCPLVIALNMNNYAKARGFSVDADALSRALGVPVVKIEAVDKTGKDDLLDAVTAKRALQAKMPCYGLLEEHILRLENLFENKFENRFEILFSLINKSTTEDKIITDARESLEAQTSLDIAEVIANARYTYIEDVVKKSVVTIEQEKKHNLSDRIDKIVTNRILGFPIFLGIMFLIFQIVFVVGAPFMEGIEAAFQFFGEAATSGLLALSVPDWVMSLVVDGIIGGVGGVVVFLPNIVLMFLLLSFLEGSGYMARVAILMDSLMKRIGLHGKSFIPMILGFGCSVPAIMATRTLETERERKLTMLLVPYLSCGARLPVYILLSGIFFAREVQGIVMFSLYVLGVLVALLVGFVLRKTIFKGESSEFIIEIPSYKIPNLKGVLLHAGNNAKDFIVHAGTVIFAACLVVWLLASLPFGVEYASSESLLGMFGSTIAPIFSPLGFGFTEAAIAIIMGVLAKEVVVGTFGTLFGVGEEALGGVLTNLFTPLSAYSFMVFILLYVPCIASLMTMKKESGSWRFMLFAAALMFGLAWLVSFIIYQGGLALGL